MEEQSDIKAKQSENGSEQTEHQVEKRDNKAERREGESRIDYNIRITRNSLKPEVFYSMRTIEEKRIDSINEFGSSPMGPIVRLYLWLVLKLSALYLAKAYIWLVRLIKRK
jgi:hypothetical protein